MRARLATRAGEKQEMNCGDAWVCMSGCKTRLVGSWAEWLLIYIFSVVMSILLVAFF